MTLIFDIFDFWENNQHLENFSKFDSHPQPRKIHFYCIFIDKFVGGNYGVIRGVLSKSRSLIKSEFLFIHELTNEQNILLQKTNSLRTVKDEGFNWNNKEGF